MTIVSKNLGVGLVRKVINASLFDFIPAEGTPNTLVGTITAGVLLQEISTLGVRGALMNTNGDTLCASWDLPGDADPGKGIYVRVRWATGSATSADTVTWKVFYKLVSIDNDALSATISTALDTVIGEDTVGSTTAYKLRGSPWGKINRNSITNLGASLELLVEMDAKAAGLSEDLYFHSLEFAYHRLVGKGGQGADLVAPTV